MGYFIERINKIFAFDLIRVCKFAEITQYTFIFLVLATIVSFLLNKYYYGKIYKINLEKKDIKSKIKDFFLLFIDILIITISFFFIRKIGLLVPSIPGLLYSKFKPYTTLDYTVHIAIVVFFIEMLPNLKKRIEQWSEISYNHHNDT